MTTICLGQQILGIEPQTLASCPRPRVLGAFAAGTTQQGRAKHPFSWCYGEALIRARPRAQQFGQKRAKKGSSSEFRLA